MDSRVSSVPDVATRVRHEDCVAAAAAEVFEAICGVQLREVEDSEDIGQDRMILAVISMIGDVDWSVFLGLPESTATACAAGFAGFAIPFDSEDMGDAIGEVTNILAGHIKSMLDRQGVKVDISLPTVMRADSMKVLIGKDGSTVKTCFDSDLGKLWIGVVTGRSAGFM